MKQTILAIALTGLCSLAHANWYLGAGYQNLDLDVEIKDSGFSEEFSENLLLINGGMTINEYIAVEGRLGLGLSGDDVTVNIGGSSAKVETEIDFTLGVYGIFSPLPESAVQPYLLLGMTSAKTNVDVKGSPANTDSESDSDLDLSYGIGVKGKINDAWAITAEYARIGDFGYQMFDTDVDVDMTGFQLGMQVSF